MTEVMSRNKSGKSAQPAQKKHWLGARCIWLCLGWVLIGLICAPISRAQVTTADLLGTITDQAGGRLPGAIISLINLDTGVKSIAKSNEVGDYIFNLLIPGRYSVMIEAQGFKRVVYNNVTLEAGDRSREDGVMTTGSAQETVTVDATPPLMQTDSSSLTSVVTEQSVEDLPLNGRNFINLVQVMPGINGGQPTAISNGNRVDNRQDTSTLSANGQSDAYNDYLMDGMDNNEEQQGFPVLRPSVDAIAAVKVDTNMFSAEIGRDTGAVVNVITKSGTNKFHGSLYNFFRNDIFDARDFFAYAPNSNLGRTGVNKPEYRQNQFGGSVGGPIFKDKTFFFGDFENRRVIVGFPSGLETVPTLYEEQSGGSDFTDFGGSLVTPSQQNQAGLAYFKMYPAPNNGGPGATANNYIAAPNETQFVYSIDGRIDQHFNNGDQIFGRYSYNHWNTVLPGDFPLVKIGDLTVNPEGNNDAGPSTTIAHGFAMSYVHSFTPNFLMELKTGYSRMQIQSFSFNNDTDASAAIGMTGVDTNLAPYCHGLLQIYPGPYANIGNTGGVPIVNTNNMFQYMGSVTYTHGGHNIKAGAQLIRRQLDYYQSIFPLGIAFFNEYSGNYMQDLVEGYSWAYVRLTQIVPQGFRIWENGEYLQDDWRVNRKLTLNLGLRYDLFPAFTEAHGQLSNFDYNSLSMVLGSQDPTVGIHTKHTNFAPRVGFSQQLWKHTLLRGGYGISYNPILRGRQIDGIDDPPYSYQNVVITTPPQATWWPNEAPPIPAPIDNLSGGLGTIPSNANTSYIHMFNLMVQHEFGANVLTVGGVGELGRHNYYNATLNDPPPPGAFPNNATEGPGPTPPYTTAAQLPNVSGISGPWPEATTNYYALQVVLERRFTSGLSFNANYTWAHDLGDATESTGGDGITGGNQPIPRLDYGNSGQDIRHRLGANSSYQLPLARESHGLMAAIAKGWVWNVLGYWESGESFGVSNGFGNGVVANQTDQQAGTPRTNTVKGQSFYAKGKSINNFLNPLAFTPQPAGTYPSGDNNVQSGPHLRRFDTSLLKNFGIKEGWTLQFRAEVYNISNTPNFNPPNSSISTWTEGPQHDSLHPILLSDYPSCNNNPNCTAVGLLPGDIATNNGGFGTIQSTAYGIYPRQFQFALKLIF